MLLFLIFFVLIQNKNTIQYNTFASIKTELSVSNNGLLLRDSRIVIPSKLQDQVVNIAHEGYQGIEKTKSLLREKVWFPNIDKLVETKVKNCMPCQACADFKVREPLKMSKLPSKPWDEVSIDFCDIPNGGHLLVIYDDYSRFPEIEFTNSTSAKTVCPKIDKIFSTQGIPSIVRSDNGPPFDSGH